MVDHNKTLNTNLNDITKTLEDMESLDMELFNDSFKKLKSTNPLKDSNIQSDGEIKKKVIFKDSNEDDLLTGLLSDEETSAKESKSLFASSSKSSLMEDIFKIKNPITSKTSIKSNNGLELHLGQEETNQLFSQKLNGYSPSKSNFIISQNESFKEKDIQKLKTISKNEDILMNLNDKCDIIDKAKRLSLREHSFENQSHSPNVVDSIIPKSNKKTELEQSTNIQESKLDAIDLSTKFFAKESRRGRRNTKIINDPLGLLSVDLLSNQNLELMTNENVSTKNSVIQNMKTEKDLPEWLGGPKKLATNEKITKIDKTVNSKQNIEIQNTNSTVDSKKSGTNNLEDTSIFPLLFGTQLHQENAFVNMQQQEHELRTATIFSLQNEQLNKITNAQHSALYNQEKQFNALLKLQYERQTLLEKQIKIQQERINQYINVLMTQSVSIPNTTIYKLDLDEEEKKFINEIKEMKDRIKKLEEEKSKLENKLSYINEKYDSELLFQAEFYERQISFLREIITKSEGRIKREIEHLETDYITKFEKLKDEKLQIENEYKEKIHNLKNEHAQNIEDLCKLHSENIKLLQKQYNNVIENISKAKQIEDQMIQIMTTRTTDIENILQRVNIIIEDTIENKKKLEIQHKEIMKSHENTLKLQEDDIKAQRLELKHQNNIFEEHRNKFIETTEKLDIRLTSLITELQKQSSLCNQAEETLEKKTTSLLKERELFEEKMKWERDYMEALKVSWMKEQERQLKLLAEEKEIITIEKAELQISNKLQNNNEIDKIELETAVKIAQEATISANRDKLKWQEKINELNIHKQILQDKENLLILRAKELEYLTQSALIKKEEGMKALKNAKHLENQNKQKFNQLQLQIQALMEKEKKIATEKYNVTKDRIKEGSLVYEIEKPERDLNVSHNFQNDIPFSEIQSKSEITTELMNIVDPNLIMLKLNLNDEFNTIDKYINF